MSRFGFVPPANKIKASSVALWRHLLSLLPSAQEMAGSSQQLGRASALTQTGFCGSHKSIPHAPALPFTVLDIIRGPLQQIEHDAKLMQGNRIFAQPNSFQNKNPLLDPLHEQIDHLLGFEMVAYIHAASILAFISPRLSRRRK
jgi:hypothetical protein